MKIKSLLCTALFAATAMSASALSLSLQYPFGAHQVDIDQDGKNITITVLDPQGDESYDPYVATAAIGMPLEADSKTVSFDYKVNGEAKITKVWYAPDAGSFVDIPDTEASFEMSVSDDFQHGEFSIAAGVEELSFGLSKLDWMRIDFEAAPGTIIELRNLSIDGTDDPMQPSFDGKVRKGYYLKLEAEDFNPGMKGDTWFTNNWTDDANADLAVGGMMDASYYCGKGYGSDGYIWQIDDAQTEIAAHENNTTSNDHYLFGMGNFWHDSYEGDNAVGGKISFEEARDWWGAWFDYDFEVAEECDAKIDLAATAPSTIWRIQIDRDYDDNTTYNENYVGIEGKPDGFSWMKEYVGCAQVALDDVILTSNQTKLPTVIDPRDMFDEHERHGIWSILGDDTGKTAQSPEWFTKIWDDGFATPELWTKANEDPTIVHIFPNSQSKDIFCEVDQQYHIDTYEASFGYPLYTAHLTPGKHTLRVYSLAQKWYFDYIRIEGIGEAADGIQDVTGKTTVAEGTKVYGLNGMYVGNTTNNLKNGIYVVKNGAQTKKFIVK